MVCFSFQLEQRLILVLQHKWLFLRLFYLSLILVVKPFLFYILLSKAGEKKQVAKEVGVRLGQASEFSLLVASIALSTKLDFRCGI